MNPATTTPYGPRSVPVRGGRKRGQKPSGPELGETPADHYLWTLGDRSNFELTATWAGVFLFLFVIITFRLNVGDIAIGLAGLGMLTDRRGVIFPRFLLFLLAFMGWCWLGVLTSRYPDIAHDSTIQLSKLGFIWWAALAAVRTRAQFRFGMIVLVGLFATHPIRGAILNLIIYNNTVNGRAVWNRVFSNPNDLAGFTLLFLTIAAGLVVTERKGIVRLGAIASCVVFPVIVFFTQSRANFLAMGVLTIAIFAGQRKKARALGFLAMVGVAAWITVPESAWERLGGVASLGDEAAIRALDDSGSANERLEIWRVARKVATDNILTGTGWGTFEYAHHDWVTSYRSLFPYFIGRPTLRDAHSTYLTVVAETGLPGMILWMSALAAVIVYAERRRRRYRHMAPKAAQQLLFLEYGLLAYGIAGVLGTYAEHSFLYFHLTWIWVAASLLEEDCQSFSKISGRSSPRSAGPPGLPGQPPPQVARPQRARPHFDPELVGYPAKSEASPAS